MLFKKITWTTPGGEYYTHIKHMLNENHLLIAGCSGSGKSVLINTLIHTLLLNSPVKTELILIDPKRVELASFKKLPHCIRYASENTQIIDALNYAVDTMNSRYKTLQKKSLKKSTESDIYIIFDEFGDLITTNKKEVEPLIIRLAQLGRAANIHLILATQNPSRKVITAGIKVNIDAAVALRCREPLESRMIIGCKGAELLPKHGQAFYLSPDYLQPQLISIPLTPEIEINQRIEFWRKQYKKNYPIISRL